MMITINKFKNNKLLVNTLIYGLSNAIYTGLPLLLLPFLIKTLKPEDYGFVDLFRSLSMIMIPIFGLSTIQSIGRFFFDLDPVQFKKFVSTIQIFQIFTSIVAIIFLIFCSSFIDKEYFTLYLLCIFYFVFNQFTESLLIIFRVNHEAKSYLLLRSINIFLELGLLYFLFIYLDSIDWKFRIYPIVISSFILAIISFFYYYKKGYKIFFSYNLLKKALLYSSPLVLHMLSGYILNIGDRFFIKMYLTPQDLGNYAVAYQIGSSINFFYTSFNLAWTPTYFKWMKENNYKQIKKVKNIVYISIPLLSVIIFICWYFISPFLMSNSQYKISNYIIIIILIANIILAFYKFESNYYFYNKNTKRLSTLTMISAIVAVLFCVLLIPRIGIIGAAIASLISYLTIYILVNFNKKVKN